MEYNKKIDGYNIFEEDSNESRGKNLKNVHITYMCNGEVFAESPVYKGVEKEKVEAIREKLFDNTLYNLNVECLCRAIPLFTIINEVERIIYNH